MGRRRRNLRTGRSRSFPVTAAFQLVSVGKRIARQMFQEPRTLGKIVAGETLIAVLVLKSHEVHSPDHRQPGLTDLDAEDVQYYRAQLYQRWKSQHSERLIWSLTVAFR